MEANDWDWLVISYACEISRKIAGCFSYPGFFPPPVLRVSSHMMFLQILDEPDDVDFENIVGSDLIRTFPLSAFMLEQK